MGFALRRRAAPLDKFRVINILARTRHRMIYRGAYYANFNVLPIAGSWLVIKYCLALIRGRNFPLSPLTRRGA
jgi:hypothetical protein